MPISHLSSISNFSAAASPWWWKPWPLPQEVEQNIRDAFESAVPPPQQLATATDVLLQWRFAQIPDEQKRLQADCWLQEARRHGTLRGRKFQSREDCEAVIEEIFNQIPEEIRRDLPRTLKGYQAGMRRSAIVGTTLSLSQFLESSRLLNELITAMKYHIGSVWEGDRDVWIHPALRGPRQEVALNMTFVHELGGHLASYNGASGFFWGVLELIGSRMFWRLLDPLSLLTTPALFWLCENSGVGTEWELVHRIPPELRRRWMEEMREAMGEHAVLLEMKRFSERIRYRREHFQKDIWLRQHLNGLWVGYVILEAGWLPKRGYVKAMSEVRFRGILGITAQDFILAEDGEAIKRAALRRVLDVLKFGAVVAGAAAVF